MGLRISDNLRRTDYEVRYVEISERGNRRSRSAESPPRR